MTNRRKTEDGHDQSAQSVLSEDRIDQVGLSIGLSGSLHLGLPIAKKFAVHIVRFVFGSWFGNIFEFDLFLVVTIEEAP